jgi:hypothetical protein
MSTEDQQRDIERSIERARDGVSDRIDELDRRLRTTLDVKSFVREHASEIITGGAVVGFLAGFGLPKPLRRIIQIGVPLAFLGWKMKQRMNGDSEDELTPPSPG